MKSRDEFVRKWRCHLAGMALFGVASEARDGPMLRASKVLDIPGNVEALLARMYDDLTEVPATNGHSRINGKVDVERRVS